MLDDAPILARNRARIGNLALQHRLPTIGALRDHAEAGLLMSYAPNLKESNRVRASLVDRILRGAKPADLPVEQPTKFELVVNLKTAKALGLRSRSLCCCGRMK
jgi:putative ABC transport system substrate-binding protein